MKENSIHLAMLVVTTINVFGFTLLGLYLTVKSRTTTVFDKIHTLYRDLMNLKEKKALNKKVSTNKIASLQLQIKHLLLEVIETRKFRFLKFSQSQNRMIADCCEELLYYDEAQKYWNRCFSSYFLLAEVESEYHRRYAQFLYNINKNKEGDAEFDKALLLANSNDGRKYINAYTYYQWATSIFLLMKNLNSKYSSINTEVYKKQVIKKLDMAEKTFDTIVNCQMKKAGKDIIAQYKQKNVLG